MTLEVRHLFVFYFFPYKVRYDQLFRLVSRDRSINSLFLYTLDCTYEEDDGMCDKIRGFANSAYSFKEASWQGRFTSRL